MIKRANTALYVLLGGVVVAAVALVGATVLIAGRSGAATAVSAISMCAWSLARTRTMPVALVVPLVFGLASLVAFVSTVDRYRRERRVLRSLPLEPFPGDERIDEIVRLTGVKLFRAPARRPAAFCIGLLRPRVVFTSGLIERLSVEEQEAAFWHEAQHARVREPLRCLAARLAATTFFWLPFLRDLYDRYVLVRELEADRLAIGKTSQGALAGALHEVIREPGLAGAVGFADLAATRVDRLFDPRRPLPSLFRRGRVALSLTALALLSAAFTYPTNVPVSKRTHTQTMMMRMQVSTPTGAQWTLVPCPF